MSKICGSCSGLITAEKTHIPSCSTCKRLFHPKDENDTECSSVCGDVWYKKSSRKKESWTCCECKNDKVVVDAEKRSDSDLLASIEKIFDRKLEQFYENRLKPIEQGLANISKQVGEHTQLISKVEKRVKDIEDNGCSKCTQIANERDELKDRVQVLETDSWNSWIEIEGLQNYTRKDNVIVTGIPVSDQEDPYQIAIKAAELAGMKITAQDIVDCHRLPSRAKDSAHPPSFIVKFVNRETKRRMIDGYRKTKPTADTFGGDKNVKIYANEHLAPLTSELFRQARSLKPMYEIVRCVNGIVYVQKNKQSQRIRIQSKVQIGKLKSAFTSPNREN
ncbi:uncharacterized protein LOC135848416 [Planococcus citri]|uniref:uncharacterized protein LOC135848416 n=1 Tax=Planococcus citri TaxID=170843 RepID=UPI0031F779BE